MSHTHASLRRSFLHASHRLINSGHAVGHVVHLTFSLQLASNSSGNKVRIVLAHHHLNRLSARWRRQNQAHVAHATHGHLHGARNRRCRERQHVYLLAHVFELLFVLHAKALFLVNNYQAQIVRIYVCGKQSVCSYQHIYGSVGKSLKRFFLLSRRNKTRKYAYLQIKRSKSREKRLVVLLSQDGSWAQNHNLTSILACLKCSSQRHLCLAKAHVSAKQTVHWLARFHVQLNVCNCAFLVWCQLIREAGFHLLLSGSVQRERITRH